MSALKKAPGPRSYSAFISYRHVPEDASWAKWLEDKIETYRVPKPLTKQGFPARLGPVFRDEDELPLSSDLSQEIARALENARALIVICSPSVVDSRWVAREIEVFRSLGKADRILPVLIRGNEEISYPQPLKNLTNSKGSPLEPIFADLRRDESRLRTKKEFELAKRFATLRIVASLIGCHYDDLRQRDWERRRRHARRRNSVLVSVAILLLVLAGLWFRWLADFAKVPHFSPWLYSPGTGSKGTPLCAMYSGAVNKPFNQNIVIKGFKGPEKYFVVSLYNARWNRPKGSSADVSFDFGDGQPLKLPGTGDGHILEVQLPTQIVAIFLLKVADGPASIGVTDTDEGWVLNGDGAKAALKDVVTCMQAGS